MSNILFKPISYFTLFVNIALTFSECEKFFEGRPWPEPDVTYGRLRGVVKLCQNQVPNQKYNYQITGKPVFMGCHLFTAHCTCFRTTFTTKSNRFI